MAKLAIKGHSTRGSEVIALLEMMGGKNNDCSGKNIYAVYAIPDNGYIYPYQHAHHKYPENFIIFTLEEFLEKFPYKVGDKVIYIKYNDGNPSVYTIQKMRWTGITIEYLLDSSGFSALTKDLQPYKEETIVKEIIYDEIDFNRCPCADKVQLILGDDFEIKEEDGKTFVVRKKNQYPKTYKECCKVLSLDEDSRLYTKGYKASLIQDFQKLLICRDAYWKIAGDWEFDFDKSCYYLCNKHGSIQKFQGIIGCNVILTFPTAEMRDAFYENFKKLIEACKELL